MNKLDAKYFKQATVFSKQWIDLTPRYTIDLGTLTWTKYDQHTFYAAIPGIKLIPGVVNYRCLKYNSLDPHYASDNYNGYIYGNSYSLTEIIITDSNYSNATTFKNAMKGVELVYCKTEEVSMYDFLYQYQDFLADDFGIIDLGSLDYIIEVSQDKNIFYAAVPLALGKFNTYGNNQYCSEYVNAPEGTTIWPTYSCCRFGGGSSNINIYDTEKQSYTVEQFKAAMSGVYLVYRLNDGVKRKSFMFNQANQDNITYFGLYSNLQTFYTNIGDTEHIASANIYLASSNKNWVYKNYDEINHSYRLQHGTEGFENVGRAYIFLTADDEAAAREIINNDPVIIYCYYKQS